MREGDAGKALLVREPSVAAGTCQDVSLCVLMNKPAAASQPPPTTKEAGADGAELLAQPCQSCRADNHLRRTSESALFQLLHLWVGRGSWTGVGLNNAAHDPELLQEKKKKKR